VPSPGTSLPRYRARSIFRALLGGRTIGVSAQGTRTKSPARSSAARLEGVVAVVVVGVVSASMTIIKRRAASEASHGNGFNTGSPRRPHRSRRREAR
jgi:chloramphenicol 3-O-phosphotransferase